jgi:hypothetical protein
VQENRWHGAREKAGQGVFVAAHWIIARLFRIRIRFILSSRFDSIRLEYSCRMRSISIITIIQILDYDETEMMGENEHEVSL